MYIFGVPECTQLEDPRLEWRAIQEAMLRDYLHTAQDVLEVSKHLELTHQQRYGRGFRRRNVPRYGSRLHWYARRGGKSTLLMN